MGPQPPAHRSLARAGARPARRRHPPGAPRQRLRGPAMGRRRVAAKPLVSRLAGRCQLIGEARRIADKRGTELTGILPGWQVEPLAHQAIESGCDRVILVEDPRLELYTSRPYTKVLAALRWKYNPE